MKKFRFSRREMLLTTSALTLAGCGDRAAKSQASEDLTSGGTSASSGADRTDAADLTADEHQLINEIMDELSLDPANGTVRTEMAAIGMQLGTVGNAIVTAKHEISTSGKRYFYWPEDDAQTFDYHHLVHAGATMPTTSGDALVTGLDTATFDMTPPLLRRMMEANFFTHGIDKLLLGDDRLAGRVIVALRGCEIVENASGDGGRIGLRDVRPDHRTCKCVYIVWEKTEDELGDRISAFPGSTVPSELYLALYQTLETSGWGYKANMMPQGLHRRQLGNMVRTTYVHPNVLRQTSTTPVIREPDQNRDTFELGHSRWDPASASTPAGIASDHVHAAQWSQGDTWEYSSAGCQVVAGRVSNDTVTGEIADFYAAMDIPAAQKIDGEYTSDKYGATYPIVILTGREARLHARDANLPDMRRIRIGSSVDKELVSQDHPILKIQRALGTREDGVFGAKAMQLLLEDQATDTYGIGSKPDGVVTPALAAAMGVNLG